MSRTTVQRWRARLVATGCDGLHARPRRGRPSVSAPTTHALCNHETDLPIHEHFTDTHGYTTHVFGLCAALGFTIGRPEQDYGPFNQLLTDRTNTRVITENWDGVLRVAASIRHGTVSAALIIRKVAAHRRQNQIARALNGSASSRRPSSFSSSCWIHRFDDDKSADMRITALAEKYVQSGTIRTLRLDRRLSRLGCVR